MFNAQFVESYRERNKDNPNAREPHPPYDETVPSFTGRVAAGGRMFIRVFPKDGSGPGRRLMSAELFEKIRALPDATKILKDALALEREPEFFPVMTVPEGTEIQFGGVSEHPVWGRGGVMQFEIMEDVREQCFSKLERIK